MVEHAMSHDKNRRTYQNQLQKFSSSGSPPAIYRYTADPKNIKKHRGAPPEAYPHLDIGMAASFVSWRGLNRLNDFGVVLKL